MSPTASTQHSIDPARRASISRPSPTSRQSPIPAPPPSTSIHYTVLIRLPFARNGFVDPEPVSWDATKDKALWKLISKASNSKDLDWEAIAERFEVGLGFLMQQAAWLYERHFEGMREQMRKLSTVAVPEGGVAMRREGSRGMLFIRYWNDLSGAERRLYRLPKTLPRYPTPIDHQPAERSPTNARKQLARDTQTQRSGFLPDAIYDYNYPIPPGSRTNLELPSTILQTQRQLPRQTIHHPAPICRR